MLGNGGRPLACRLGDWPNFPWLGRRCRSARLRFERACRSQSSGAQLRFGAGTLLACATVGSAVPSAPEGGPEGQRQKTKTLSDIGHPRRRATDVLLALNAAVFALNWLSKDVLLLWGAKINSLIAGGQLWRLVTPLFLHSNLFHVAINMYALHSLGPQVEVVSGTGRTAVIYMASGILATATSFFFSPNPSVGASGAIFGLGAALAMFFMRHKDVLGSASEAGLRSLGLTVAINAVYSLANKRLDNWGHLGGAVGGFLLAYLLGPRLVVTRGEAGTRGLQDLPPLKWLAFSKPAAGGPPGGGRNAGGRDRSSTGATPQPTPNLGAEGQVLPPGRRPRKPLSGTDADGGNPAGGPSPIAASDPNPGVGVPAPGPL